MPTIIQINDNNLLIQQNDSWAKSQGYAWLKEGEVHFDLESSNNAARNCRLEPQQINSRYWQQCSQTALSNNDSGMRHAADLIWRHLLVLQEKYQLEEVALLVPSHYQAPNLSLLLGVAKAAKIQVAGLANKAVANLYSQVQGEGKYLHIDVQLHQTVCSEVIVKADTLLLGRVEILHDVGLQPMQDAVLRAIQERFISSDRFDPLHYAETEQQMFDQLPEIADQIRRVGKANVRVNHQGRQHACSIDSKQWADALKEFANQLNKIEPEIENRYCDFNGFSAIPAAVINCDEINGEQKLATDMPAMAMTDESNNIVYGTEFIFSKREPHTAEPANVMTAQPSPATPSPTTPTLTKASEKNVLVGTKATHLMQSGLAVKLAHAHIEFSDGSLTLSAKQSSNVASLLQERKVFVMSDRSRDQFQPDDRIGSDLADGVITVISVIA